MDSAIPPLRPPDGSDAAATPPPVAAPSAAVPPMPPAATQQAAPQMSPILRLGKWLAIGVGALIAIGFVADALDGNDPSPTASSVAPPPPAVSSAPPAAPTQDASYGGRLGDKHFALDDLQIKDDGLGDIGGVARITNVSDQPLTMTFTVSFFQNGQLVGSAIGSANDVAPGQTVTESVISQDPIINGPFKYQFQVDAEF